MAGTYNGSFSMNGSTINASLAIQQNPPAVNGIFPISVSATFSNAGACGGFTSAGPGSGGQFGIFVATHLVPNAAASGIDFSGFATDPTAKTISGLIIVSGGPCDQMKGTATLTAQ
jgi:hypothetical protein